MKVGNDTNSKFYKFMKKYYAFKPMRVFITFSIFVSEVALILYLMVLPIQLAYHSMLRGNTGDAVILNNIDFVVCAFFTYHIFLYFDFNIQKIIKSPNSLPKYKIQRLGKWTRLVTIQLLYDIITWGISIFMASPEQNTFSERIIQLIFFLKIYKAYKFNKKITKEIIGTNLYPVYNIFFTILVTFTVISYLSSIFYAIDYAIYTKGGPLMGDIWLVGMGTEPNLVEKPFWVQLLMINYWAMGTSSTAAYGDICGQAPQQIIYNIFILYFANFLYGWYLNNIQIIPKQIKQRQRNILQRFTHFQNYNRIGKVARQRQAKNKFSDQLYLKILCSIEYNQTEKSTRKVIEQSVPQKYLQQIKVEIYTQFFASQQLKMYQSRGFFHNEQTLLSVAKIITQSVFQKHQNVYDYQSIDPTDLFYINQGSVELRLPKELGRVVKIMKSKSEMFGQYAFITNQRRKIRAVCEEYVSAYIIKREDYKKSLSFDDLKYFNSMLTKCLEFKEQRIQQDPNKLFNDSLEKQQSPIVSNKPSARCKTLQEVIRSRIQKRNYFERQNIASKKVFIRQAQRKKKSIGIQTDEEEFNEWKKAFESVISL